MPEIFNLQRKVRIDRHAYTTFAENLRTHVRETEQRDFSVGLVSDRRMAELNKLFRGKASTTDVLSFPREPDEFEFEITELGDIVISIEQAAKQADENGLTIESEIKQLILHGVLHLCGYDHETDSGEMNSRELELRDSLGI